MALFSSLMLNAMQPKVGQGLRKADSLPNVVFNTKDVQGA